MSTPYTFSGTLSFPADPGGPQTPIVINFADQFDQIIAETLTLAGSGSKTFDLSAIAGGVRCLMVKVDPQVLGTPPVFVKVNSETVGEEIQPGGFKVTGSPNPSAGITSVTVVWTGIGKVRFWALG